MTTASNLQRLNQSYFLFMRGMTLQYFQIDDLISTENIV